MFVFFNLKMSYYFFKNGIQCGKNFISYFDDCGNINSHLGVLNLIMSSPINFNYPFAPYDIDGATTVVTTDGFLRPDCDYIKFKYIVQQPDIEVTGRFNEVIWSGEFLPHYEFEWEIEGESDHDDVMTFVKIFYVEDRPTYVGYLCLDINGSPVILKATKRRGRFILPGYSMFFVVESKNHNLNLTLRIRKIEPIWRKLLSEDGEVQSPWEADETFYLDLGRCSVPIYQNILNNGIITRNVFPEFQSLNNILRNRYYSIEFLPCSLSSSLTVNTQGNDEFLFIAASVDSRKDICSNTFQFKSNAPAGDEYSTVSVEQALGITYFTPKESRFLYVSYNIIIEYPDDVDITRTCINKRVILALSVDDPLMTPNQTTYSEPNFSSPESNTFAVTNISYILPDDRRSVLFSVSNIIIFGVPTGRLYMMIQPPVFASLNDPQVLIFPDNYQDEGNGRKSFSPDVISNWQLQISHNPIF